MDSHGAKREAPPIEDTENTCQKKVRTVQDFAKKGMNAVIHHESKLDLTRTDLDLSYDEQSDSSSIASDEETQHSVSTPLTPLSSKNSPLWPPSQRKTLPCTYPDCNKTFNRPAKLTQHLRSHTNTRPFVCPNTDCNKAFLRSSHLKHHIKSAHSDVRDYACDYNGCGKSFATGTRLRRHHATHEGRQKFPCTIGGCGQTFRKHNTLQKHVVQVHEGRKPFVCEVPDAQGTPCGAGFDEAGRMNVHIASAHSARTYDCAICSNITQAERINAPTNHESPNFTSLLELQSHIRSEHPPTCQECGSKFARRFDLQVHIDAQHKGFTVDERKKHQCLEPGCGRSFTAKNNLAAHVRNFHQQPRAFICGRVDPNTLSRIPDWDGSDACGRSFSTKGNLVEHIRMLHLGLESGKRNRSQKGTVSGEASMARGKPSKLLQLTGSGYKNLRTLECPFEDCVYRFCKEFDLQRHLQMHHGLQESDAQMFRADADAPAIRYSLDGSYYLVTSAEVEADRALALQFGNDGEFEDYFDQLEASAAQGGDFWLGGKQQAIIKPD